MFGLVVVLIVVVYGSNVVVHLGQPLFISDIFEQPHALVELQQGLVEITHTLGDHPAPHHHTCMLSRLFGSECDGQGQIKMGERILVSALVLSSDRAVHAGLVGRRNRRPCKEDERSQCEAQDRTHEA